MKYIIYQKNYDRASFYKLMGQFFAERVFQRMFPYLSNENGRIWIVATEEKIVRGFTTFINRKSYLDLGYTFAADQKLYHELLEQRFILVTEIYPWSPLRAALTDQKELFYWLDRGFEVERETKNYIFVRKEAKNDTKTG